MNFGCSVFFSAICVLTSVIFSVFCIYLLFQERKEVGISLISSDELKIYDKAKYKTAMKIEYDLTDDEGVRLFQKKLANYRYQYHKLNMEKLLCVRLNRIEIFRNRSELQLERMGADLVEHLNGTFYQSLLEQNTNASEIRQTLKIFELTVLRFFRSRNYYIFRNRLCLVLDYFWFTEHYMGRLFGDAVSSQIFIKDSHYIVRLKKSNDAFDLRLILNNNNPNMNCSNNGTEFECLDSCLKEKHRLSKYFYNGNETGTIQLPSASSNASIKKQIAEHEAACFEKCNQRQCVIAQIEIKNVEVKYSNNSNSSTDLINSSNLIRIKFYEFSPLISKFSFFVQVTGLTLSFFGVSCYNLALKVTTNSLLLPNKKLVNSLFKFVLWTVCLTVFLFLSKESMANYSKTTYGDRTAKTSVSYPTQPEQTAVVVCVPVSAFLQGVDTEKMTLAELELATNDSFHRTVNEVYLEYFERYDIEWKVKDTVLFNANDFTSELGRCFQIETEDLKEEPEYHSIWSELRLVVTFKHANYELYILPENQALNYNSFRFDPNKTAELSKVTFKSSPLKCADYKLEYSSCDSRWNCLDECIVNKSIENDLDIPILHVIDKKLFDPIDWSEYSPNYNLKGNPKLEDKCREQISSPDCSKIYFESDSNGGSNFGTDWARIKIDLYPIIILKIEGEQAAGYDVLLDLLNVLTIIFDFQAINLLTAVVFFFKVKVFELQFGRKLFLYPIYAFCVAGLALHVLFIFDQVQNSRLVFSHEFHDIPDQPMPEINFCFEHDRWQEADQELNSTGEFLFGNETGYDSGKLTGNHLEIVTSDYRVDTVFGSIEYLSSENEWVELNLTGMPTEKPRFKWQDVTFERFYFLNKKCLSISTNQTYNRSRFYFEDTFDGSYEVVRLNFNRSFIQNDQIRRSIVFYSRTEKRFLSELSFLNYTSPDLGSEQTKISYTVRQEQFEIINNDKLRLIKNPLLYGNERFNNAGKYMAGLMKAFRKEHNATTLELPMTHEYFDLPIKNELFEDWEEKRRPKKRNPKTRNQPEAALLYERKLIENLVEKHYHGADKPDFKFHLMFGKFKQVFRTKANLAAVILNLMNSLSLWLSISFFQTFVLKSGLFGGAKSAVQSEPVDRNDAKTSQNQPESELAMIESNFDTRYDSL